MDEPTELQKKLKELEEKNAALRAQLADAETPLSLKSLSRVIDGKPVIQTPEELAEFERGLEQIASLKKHLTEELIRNLTEERRVYQEEIIPSYEREIEELKKKLEEATGE